MQRGLISVPEKQTTILPVETTQDMIGRKLGESATTQRSCGIKAGTPLLRAAVVACKPSIAGLSG